MSVIANRKTAEGGEIIVIKTRPFVGVIGLTAFTESLTGVTVGSYFVNKLFRYSTDGITFSEWELLTVPNITGLSFNSDDTLIIELQYQKNGPDPALDVNDVTFTETTSPTGYDETYFGKSIFAEYFNTSSLELLDWYLNVVEKIYEKGLIPNYIDRLNQFGSTEDFIDFWKSIAKYFGYYVIYARVYAEFYNNYDLLTEYLEERGLKCSRENTLSELQYLMDNYYKEISQRGTVHIIDDKIWKGDVIDGEMLRLIYYKPVDEFLFNLHKNEHFGWNLNNSSPLWRGLYLNESLQKVQQSNELTKSDPNLGYEVSFWIQTAGEVTVDVEAFDENNAPVQLKLASDGTLTNTAINAVTLMRSDKAIFVRVCLFSQTRPLDANDLTNLNQGNNLIFTSDVRYIKPRVYVDGVEVILTASGLDKFRVAPLFTNYSHGILQVYHWISCWLRNNNSTYSHHQIKQFVRKYLIPFNSHFEFVDLITDFVDDGSIPVTTTTTTLQEFAWRGIGPSCEYTTETVETEWIGEEETAICESDGEPVLYYWIGEEETAICVQE